MSRIAKLQGEFCLTLNRVVVVGAALFVMLGSCVPVFVCGPGADDEVDVRSCVEGTEVLSFSRQRAYGFCPKPTDLFSAVITADESGKHTFCATQLLEAPSWCPNCVKKSPDYPPCLVEVPISRQVLSDGQVQNLGALLAAVPELTCDDTPIVVDWCIVDVYEFQGRRVEAVCTYGEELDDFRSAIHDVESFLHEVMAGP